MEEQIQITGNDVILEALCQANAAERGAVIAHPHPLYGGSMYNNVVQRIVDTLFSAGWSTLRFNFRGVGGSTGSFDEGNGEKSDLASATQYLSACGIKQLFVFGYSYGAWIAAMAWDLLQQLHVTSLVLVAPPLAAMRFEPLSPALKIQALICGEHDDIAPPHLVKNLGQRLASPIDPLIIPGADHFFFGQEKHLGEAITSTLPQL